MLGFFVEQGHRHIPQPDQFTQLLSLSLRRVVRDWAPIANLREASVRVRLKQPVVLLQSGMKDQPRRIHQARGLRPIDHLR